MSYEILVKRFTDLEDDRRIYQLGDEYPADDAKMPTKERINELLTTDNKAGVQIIKDTEDTTGEKDNLEDLELPELKELADEKDIDYAKNATKETMLELLQDEE